MSEQSTDPRDALALWLCGLAHRPDHNEPDWSPCPSHEVDAAAMADALRRTGHRLLSPAQAAEQDRLVAAARRFDAFLQHEFVMYSDEDSPGSLIDTEMRHRFDDEVDAFHAALAEPVTGEPEREVEDERRRAYDGLDMPR